MRTRAIGICTAALLGLGCSGVAATAAQAKTKLWLEHTGVRATVGETTHELAYVEECELEQQGSLLSNGAAVDQFATGTGGPGACPGGEKLAGSFTKITAAASATTGMFTMTVLDKIHVQVEPWCTYQLPAKITGQPVPESDLDTTVQAKLDKSASFGACPATREVRLTLYVFPEEGGFYEREEPSSET